jgi:hypothetical protein
MKSRVGFTALISWAAREFQSHRRKRPTPKGFARHGGQAEQALTCLAVGRRGEPKEERPTSNVEVGRTGVKGEIDKMTEPVRLED